MKQPPCSWAVARSNLVASRKERGIADSLGFLIRSHVNSVPPASRKFEDRSDLDLLLGGPFRHFRNPSGRQTVVRAAGPAPGSRVEDSGRMRRSSSALVSTSRRLRTTRPGPQSCDSYVTSLPSQRLMALAPNNLACIRSRLPLAGLF